MGYILLGLCLVLAFMKPNSKKATIVVLVYIWCIYALNTYTPDGVYYARVYKSMRLIRLFYYEPAYTALMMLCRWLGLTFQGFRMVLASIYVPFLYFVIKKLTPYTTYVLALFLIFPLTYFHSVLRGGLASLVILFGLRFLLSEQKRDVWKYVLCVGAAMLVHLSSALFLILLFTRKKVEAKWLLAVVAAMFTVCVLIRFTDIPYSIASRFTDSERILTWTRYANDGDPNLKGYIGMTAAVLGSVCLSGFLRYKLKEAPADRVEMQQPDVLRVADVIYRANVMMLILMPLLMLSSVYIRFIYQLFAMNLCLCANVSAAVGKRTGKGRFITWASLLGLLWVIGYMVYSNHPFTFSHLRVYNFENNLLSLLF